MVPFFNRLMLDEYIALVIGILLSILEEIIRFISAILPGKVFDLLYGLTKSTSDFFLRTSERNINPIAIKIRKARNVSELCSLFNFEVESHLVTTEDNYLLTVQRIVKRGKNPNGRPVVYLHHGLMMSSEIWVANVDRKCTIPFLLVEAGFDVWLGNNRGNKYCRRSWFRNCRGRQFWDFSLDELALFDLKANTRHVLEITGQKTLQYIGFSQGTALMFAALSLDNYLSSVVSNFVALAPTMAPNSLPSILVTAVINASPLLIYLIFGRGSILNFAEYWEAVLYPPLYDKLLSASMNFLFDWKLRNISIDQKHAAFSHLYCRTSVKAVYHWFQIIKQGKLQMFNEEDQAPAHVLGMQKHFEPYIYPTKKISIPMTLIYGGKDTLFSLDRFLPQLPDGVAIFEIPHYEHIDSVWADDLKTEVIPIVLSAIRKNSIASSEIPPSSSAILIDQKHYIGDQAKSWDKNEKFI